MITCAPSCLCPEAGANVLSLTQAKDTSPQLLSSVGSMKESVVVGRVFSSLEVEKQLVVVFGLQQIVGGATDNISSTCLRHSTLMNDLNLSPYILMHIQQ